MAEFIDDTQKSNHIAALIRERDHYERYGIKDRLAAVDKELSRLGAKAQTPAQRSSKRGSEG